MEVSKGNTNLLEQIFTTQRKEIKYKKDNLKKSKSFNMLPCLKKHGNKLFSKKGSDLLINQQDNDPDNLKQELVICKNRMFQQNNNYIRLKIKYGKLYNENLTNKNLISNVLGVPLDKCLTKEEFIDKIENAKINKGNREILKEAVDLIVLRNLVKDKKEMKQKKEKYLKELDDNSKTKKLNEVLKDFVSKCEEQRSLLRILKALKEKNDSFENESRNLKENIEKINSNRKEIIKRTNEKNEIYEKLVIEKNEIVKENKYLDERLKKNKLINKEREDKNIQIELAINDIKEEYNELESYKNERDNKIKDREEKEKLLEELKKQRNEQENEIKELNKEKDTLEQQLSEYNMEKPRLMKKAKEPKS